MNRVSPSPALIRAQAAAILLQRPEDRVIGFHSPSPWAGEETFQAHGSLIRVRSCGSPLEIREALVEAEGAVDPTVLVTPLRDEDVEADVLARLARRRIHVIRPWDTVRDVLQLREIDSRLDDAPWMAERLLEVHAAGGAQLLTRGFLDADSAWDLVAASLGLSTGRPDALELLRWAGDDGLARFQAEDEAVQDGLRRRVRETAGPAGEAILASVSSGSDALAVGLACGVVFDAAAPPEARIALERAAVRLERYCGHRAISAAAGRAWATAAETLVEDSLRGRGLQEVRPFLQRADTLLREVEAQDHALLGRFSALGFEQRLANVARALDDGLAQSSAPPAPPLSDAVQAVRAHGLSAAQPDRVERTEMAVRLLRWLGRAADAASPSSFEEAAMRYATDTGSADWVRAALEAGDGCELLSAAYGRLLQRVAEQREAENERFGQLLANWIATDGSLHEALRIEEVLAEILAPLAARGPVLLLVVDGMSMAVYRELGQDLVREGWIELATEGHSAVRPIIAALPTVTDVSRASLLCGRLVRGVAADEKAGFQVHPVLLKHTGREKPPILFHKADLGEGGEAGLATAVRAELADPDRRVVGIVVNAVDDHLARGDQIRLRWGIETIGPLRTVLHAAQQAGRCVVVTSDHGHVPERGSEGRSYPEAERWRAVDGAPGPGEVVIHGSRVVLPTGGRLIAPWSERLRYGAKKNGYHSGVSPQEVVVPLGVFTPGLEVEGWAEVPAIVPAWWSEDERPAVPTPRRALRKKVRAPEEQAPLFPEPTVDTSGGDWVSALLKSPVWKAQLQVAGRVSGEAERLRQALQALDERGGTLTRMALGNRLGLPPVRVGGFVAGLRRVLNVDGYDVLEVDDSSDTLSLNRELLRKQFELP